MPEKQEDRYYRIKNRLRNVFSRPKGGLKPFISPSPELDIEDVILIREHTQKARASSEGLTYLTFADEMEGHAGVNRGDYQEDLEIYSSEGKQPINLVTEIRRYCEELLSAGEKQVNVVDFGAARATTLCQASRSMENLVKQSRVKFTATNLYTAPVNMDILDLRVNNYGEFDKVLYALQYKTLDFVKADILELYEMMRDKPIHLMFMFHVFEIFNAGDYSDTLLKIAGKMLHPNLGTIVIGHASSQPLLEFNRGWNIDLFNQGQNNLEAIALKRTLSTNRFQVFQAPVAPNFSLHK